jgi:hypothetical protein
MDEIASDNLTNPLVYGYCAGHHGAPLSAEIWKQVDGWSNRYEVSNLGNVRFRDSLRHLALTPLPSTGLSLSQIGKSFGVGKSAIGRIFTGKTWKHASSPLPPKAVAHA